MNANLFHVDVLTVIMAALIGFIGLCVATFSWRYLKGDRAYGRFFVTLALLIAALFVFVSADHVALFLGALGTANLLLVRFMIHKGRWRAARESGWLALRHFAVGFAAMAAGFALLHAQGGTMSLQALHTATYDRGVLAAALGLIALGAMVQCGLWPFHRWLTSSLNSPTPVSAIMHAGLVNGGGFVLARLAPLYAQVPELLTALFVLGLGSALLGTLWKLMQSDIKRMLACSTMGQMGFMIAQCGTGLFPAAIAHLICHGLFKAYLFLASGAAAREKRLDPRYPPSARAFALALLCGAAGMSAFSITGHIDPRAGDTTLFLLGLVLIAGTQLALPILQHKAAGKAFALALPLTAGSGALYGLAVHGFESLFAPLGLMRPQDLNAFHMAGFAALTAAWLAMLFGRGADRKAAMPPWMLRFYVAMLNAAQPHPKTVTAHRNHYRYE